MTLNVKKASNAKRRRSLTVAESQRQTMFANMDRQVMSATNNDLEWVITISHANQVQDLNAYQRPP